MASFFISHSSLCPQLLVVWIRMHKVAEYEIMNTTWIRIQNTAPPNRYITPLSYQPLSLLLELLLITIYTVEKPHRACSAGS